MSKVAGILEGNEKMFSRETQDLARRLLDCEAVAGETSEPNESAAARVSEKLRGPLSALVGVADYRSFLFRALTLARAEAPSLSAVQVTADGSFQGLGELKPQSDKDHAGEGEVILIAQLIGLFLTFLGEALTLRLVQDVSPHLKIPAESGTPALSENILQEVGHLHDVSDRLESLANQHSLVQGPLLSVSGNIRNTATALEVFALIRTKSGALRKKAPKQELSRYVM